MGAGEGRGSQGLHGELLLTGKQAGVWVGLRAALGPWVLLSGCLQLYRGKISNRMSLGYALSSQRTLGGTSIWAKLVEVGRTGTVHTWLGKEQELECNRGQHVISIWACQQVAGPVHRSE